MIPHICQVDHNPPHCYGDCLRACIASICNVENVLDVPHFLADGDDEAGDKRLREYLLTRGYRPYISAFHTDTTLENIFAVMDGINHDVEYLLFLSSGGGDHVVVCRNGTIIHNPSWSWNGSYTPIDGPLSNGMWYVLVLVPINP